MRYWFWGRPSVEQLRQDLREVTRTPRPDWDLEATGLRSAGEAGDKSRFWPYDELQRLSPAPGVPVSR